jgi:small GTP-binding protein
MSYDYLFKIIFIGDTNVGKTALVDRLINDRFASRHDSTIGVDFATILNVVNNQYRIKSHIWDTAGQNQFSSIISNYYKGIAGVAIIFDVNRISSFKKVEFWRQEFEQNKDHASKISTILIGNKTDKNNRMVPEIVARNYAEENGMLYIETSAKNNKNIHKSFQLLLEDICNNMDTNDLGIGIRRHFSYKKKEVVRDDSCGFCDCCCIS